MGFKCDLRGNFGIGFWGLNLLGFVLGLEFLDYNLFSIQDGLVGLLYKNESLEHSSTMVQFDMNINYKLD
jgi:hypothetical protein